MFCAAGVTAQFVAGKATRDAIYLANLDVTSLPAMVIATAAVSIGLVVLMSRGLRYVTPGAFVPSAGRTAARSGATRQPVSAPISPTTPTPANCFYRPAS